MTVSVDERDFRNFLDSVQDCRKVFRKLAEAHRAGLRYTGVNPDLVLHALKVNAEDTFADYLHDEKVGG